MIKDDLDPITDIKQLLAMIEKFQLLLLIDHQAVVKDTTIKFILHLHEHEIITSEISEEALNAVERQFIETEIEGKLQNILNTLNSSKVH